MEDNLNGRQSQWKTTSRKRYRKQMTSACLASKSCTELGPAQPQLVFILLICMDTLANKKQNEFERIVYSLDGNISTLLNNAPNVTDRKICTRQ